MNSTLTTVSTNLTSIQTTSKDNFYLLMFFFRNIHPLLLITVGCIGNGFVILVFGQRALRTTIGSIGFSMSAYPFLFYMAISDNIYLFILFCSWLNLFINILHRPVVCQLSLYITYVCNFINAYYTIAFTAQRLFAVIKPFRVTHVLSWYRSRCLALLIISIACLLYLYLPFLTGLVDGACYSLKETRRINELMDVIDCVIVFLIPYIIIITMNGIIWISLKRIKRTEYAYLFRNNLNANKDRELKRRNASHKMTKLLLTVSTSYLIIGGPYACIHVWRLLFLSKESPIFTRVQRIEYYFHSIYHITFAMNFYIYIIFGSKFRRELQRLIKTKLNICQCFSHENIYTNTDSINPNNSSNFEQFQIMDVRKSPKQFQLRYKSKKTKTLRLSI